MADVCEGKRKRVRDDEVADDSPDSKIARSDSAQFRSELDRTSSGGSELGRVDAGDDSSEIHRDLIDILDESDNVVGEREPAIQDLDSVIKSFEEEILAPGSDLASEDPNIPSMESSDLRHLLEASDDELGLPPTVTPAVDDEGKPETEDFRRVGPDGIDLSNFIGFDDDIPQYESLGYGSGVFVEYGGAGDDNAGGFVTLDGLFDYSEPSDILWRSESLQAM